MASARPDSTSMPTTRHRDRRKAVQHRRQRILAPPRHHRQRRQCADPIGNADPVQEQRRPGQPLRRAVRHGRSRPAKARRPASPPRSAPSDGHGRASHGNQGHRHRDDRDQQRRVPGWWQNPPAMAPASRSPTAADPARSSPCKPSEATALTRPIRSAPMISPLAARALPDPGREKRPADADEQPEIDADPRQPDQDGNSAVARSAAAAAVVAAPIENTSDPPTGCPSAEMTR